jgi:outer membrane immunogenic protein
VKSKKLFQVFCVLLVWSFAFSQENLSFGISTGLNFSSISGEDADDANSHIGYTAGGFLQYSLNENMFIKPEIQYSQKGWKEHYEESYDGESYTEDLIITLNYLDLPLMFGYSINNEINLMAGPFISVYLDGKYKATYTEDGESESYSEDIEDSEVSSTQYGFCLGAGYDYSDINIGLRFQHSIKKFADDFDASLNMIQLTISVKL